MLIPQRQQISRISQRARTKDTGQWNDRQVTQGVKTSHLGERSDHDVKDPPVDELDLSKTYNPRYKHEAFGQVICRCGTVRLPALFNLSIPRGGCQDKKEATRAFKNVT